MESIKDDEKRNLTDEIARKIYVANGAGKDIAKRFGLESWSTVYAIRQGRVRQRATAGLVRGAGSDRGKGSRGMKSPRANITEEIAIGIYRANGSMQDIADQFGVPMGTVSHIRTGRSWGHTTRHLQRGRIGERKHRDQRGSLNHSTSITEAQAVEIYTADGSSADIARRMGLTASMVGSIRRGTTWSHATGGLTRGKDGRSSMTAELAAKIYQADGSAATTAERFGVPLATASGIRGGSTWHHVTRELTPGRKARKGENGPVGSQHPTSQITEEQAAAIYQADGSSTQIALRMGLSRSIVSGVRSGATWRHVTENLAPGRRSEARRQVYIITAKEFPGLCKIGMASNPAKRLKQLNTGYPTGGLVLRYTVVCDDAWVSEALIHKALDTKRVNGEWYRVDIGYAKRLLDSVRSKDDRPCKHGRM